MLSKIIFRLSFLIASAFSLNFAYSVFAFPLTVPCIDTGTIIYFQLPYSTAANCNNSVQERLEAAKAAGFNTIDITYWAAQGPETWNGAFAGSQTWRAAYRDLFRRVLEFDGGRFNISVRINIGERSLSGADPTRYLSWDPNFPGGYDQDHFLKHAHIDSPNVAFTFNNDPSGGRPWDGYVDFYELHPTLGAIRHRTTNPWHPVVRGLARDFWKLAIEDVVSAADSVGGTAPQRVLWFTLNWSSTGESEYQHDFFAGGQSFWIYYDPNDDPDRIDWIQARQDSLASLHGEFSDMVKTARDTSPGFDFRFGAQWSGIEVGTSVMRGHIDLALLASYLNVGDWIHVADIADTYWLEFNHNFSMDYARSIASTYGLKISNESSWATFLDEQHSVGINATNDAYRQQAERSLNHGAAAFFVTNWAGSDQLPYLTDIRFEGNHDPDYYFLPMVREFEGTQNASQPRGQTAIFLDPWALYATEDGSGYNSLGGQTFITKNLYETGVFKEIYDTLSNNGANRVDILTSTMLVDHPEILDEYRRIYIPALDSILSTDAKGILMAERNKKKLTLFGTKIGTKNKYQESTGADSLSSLLAADLLWVDQNNLYPNDEEENWRSLQVALSSQAQFPDAEVWTGQDQLSPPNGSYVGDFNGDGRDDVLNYSYYGEFSVYLADSAGGAFKSPGTWGYADIDPQEIRIGDFNGDGFDDVLWIDRYDNWDQGLWLFESNGIDGFSSPEEARKPWSGIESSLGFFAGDFDGDGVDDLLRLTDEYALEFADSALYGPVGWGGWGPEPENVRVGDFNGDGRDDLLWVDTANRYPSDRPSAGEFPGLQVALSSGSGFPVAHLWKKWYGLATSRGFYVGDFNGDGRDDFMNFTSGYGLQVVLATNRFSPRPTGWKDDTTNFSAGTQNWGSWGADAEDLYVGNFGRFGGILPKRGAQSARIALSEKKILNQGNVLLFRGLSGPVALYDFSGKRVLRGSVRDRGTLDISSLSTGTYFVQMSGYRTKFVKMHR
jgi:hypothetical protein